MTVFLPAPNAFSGENPDRTMLMVAFTARGIYIPAPVWNAGSMILVAVFALCFAAMIGHRIYAKKLLFDTARLRPMGWPPMMILLLQTILIFFMLGRPIGMDVPVLKSFNFGGGTMIGAPLIYIGATIAENVHACIQALSYGHTEVALGLCPRRIMRLVLLPQTKRVIM